VRTSILRTARLALAALVLALVPPGASGALPREGVLIAGSSLGGVRIGMAKQQVERAWGSRFGRCRSCLQETWYFTYRPFAPQGAAVSFDRKRVVRVYTLWQPKEWRTSRGLELGASEADVNRALGYSGRVACGTYDAIVRTGPRADTVYYLDGAELWGFGLMVPGASPCVELVAAPHPTASRRAG
jgi:hypothetical protein